MPGDGVHLRAVEELLHPARGLVAGGHRLDDRSRPADGVAGGKHMRDRGLHGLRVDGDGVAGGQGEFGQPFGPRYVDALADGRDDRITVDDEFGSRHRYGTPAGPSRRAAPIRCAGHSKTADMAVGGHDADRCRQIIKGDPFVFGPLDLVGIGRHFVLRAAVHHGDGAGAQTPGHPGGVDGHIATAHHHNVFTWRLAIAQVDGLQEIAWHR